MHDGHGEIYEDTYEEILHLSLTVTEAKLRLENLMERRPEVGAIHEAITHAWRLCDVAQEVENPDRYREDCA